MDFCAQDPAIPIDHFLRSKKLIVKMQRTLRSVSSTAVPTQKSIHICRCRSSLLVVAAAAKGFGTPKVPQISEQCPCGSKLLYKVRLAPEVLVQQLLVHLSFTWYFSVVRCASFQRCWVEILSISSLFQEHVFVCMYLQVCA